MSDEAQKPQSSRLFKPLFLSLLAVVVVIAVGAAIAIPAIARANHREAMELNAQQDARVLADAYASLEEAAKHYDETNATIAQFTEQQLEPANELISAKSEHLPSDEVETFIDQLGELNSRLDGNPIEEPFNEDFDKGQREATLNASYLEADEKQLAQLRADVSDEADEYARRAEQLTDSAQKLEEEAASSAEAFNALLSATADEATTVLSDNAKASKKSREALARIIKLLQGNEAMPIASNVNTDGAFIETWLQATDALSKYPDAVQSVRDSHKKATAPKPKPTPPPSTGSGGSGGNSSGSGGGNSGTCTWMVWGPVAPYWVWGPCSEMPK